jgi:hypothetical protein
VLARRGGVLAGLGSDDTGRGGQDFIEESDNIFVNAFRRARQAVFGESEHGIALRDIYRVNGGGVYNAGFVVQAKLDALEAELEAAQEALEAATGAVAEEASAENAAAAVAAQDAVDAATQHLADARDEVDPDAEGQVRGAVGLAHASPLFCTADCGSALTTGGGADHGRVRVRQAPRGRDDPPGDAHPARPPARPAGQSAEGVAARRSSSRPSCAGWRTRRRGTRT